MSGDDPGVSPRPPKGLKELPSGPLFARKSDDFRARVFSESRSEPRPPCRSRR